MKRTYRLPARVDEVDERVRVLVAELGRGFDDALLHAAVVEAVLNAIIHGALRVPSGTCRDPLAFVDAVHAAQCAYVGEPVVAITDRARGSDVCAIVVRDPGDGFDVARAIDGLDALDPLATSGRGLLMMRAAAERVAWNRAGNEVTLTFRARIGAPSIAPSHPRSP